MYAQSQPKGGMMITVPVTLHTETAPYVTPVLRRFGSATELTKQRSMSGGMDGGANSSRTN